METHCEPGRRWDTWHDTPHSETEVPRLALLDMSHAVQVPPSRQVLPQSLPSMRQPGMVLRYHSMPGTWGYAPILSGPAKASQSRQPPLNCSKMESVPLSGQWALSSTCKVNRSGRTCFWRSSDTVSSHQSNQKLGKHPDFDP